MIQPYTLNYKGILTKKGFKDMFSIIISEKKKDTTSVMELEDTRLQK